ncbi:hypothetical protein [Thermococcus stetteri]|uniref:hypothetical protein n=1 Tax=Thermococcus stetteri TaxID=49900 RepID=UPI001AE3F797|nr:hypothetical protein [Thermococcus stetteri]MBP1912770.1 hypothetical protein [Thermococcus stetteri]
MRYEIGRIKSSFLSWGTIYILAAIPLGVSFIRGLATKSWDVSIPIFLTAVLGPSSLGRYKWDVKNGLIPRFFALPIEPWDLIRIRALLSILLSFTVGSLNVFILWFIEKAVGNGVHLTPAIITAAITGAVGSALISPSVWIRNMWVNRHVGLPGNLFGVNENLKVLGFKRRDYPQKMQGNARPRHAAVSNDLNFEGVESGIDAPKVLFNTLSY